MYVCALYKYLCVPKWLKWGWGLVLFSKSVPEQKQEPELKLKLKLLCINFRSLFAFDNCMGNISTTILQIAFVCQGGGERWGGGRGS